MKFIKFLFCIGCILFTSHYSLGQTFEDALRYSQIWPSGSARSVGVGLSSSVFGADYGTIYVNPAGLSSFRRSEFTITGSAPTRKTTLSQGSFEREDNVGNFTIPQAGAVFTWTPRRSTSFTNLAIGVGLQELAHFDREMFGTQVSRGSITEKFLNDAEGLDTTQLDPFGSELAWLSGALFHDQGNYFIDYSGQTDLSRDLLLVEDGGIYEFQIAFSGNIKEKWQFGVGIGIPVLTYDQSQAYSESDPNNEVEFFDELLYETNLTTEGTGFNAKLGVIFKPTHQFRVGVAIHTPTWYSLTDRYTADFSFTFDEDLVSDPGPYTSRSPVSNFNYKLSTPWKYQVDAGYLFGKNGFISAGVSLIDYSANEFNYENGFEEFEISVNENIKDNLADVIRLRAGGEAALNKWRLRAGIFAETSAYEVGEENNLIGFSTGAGYRWRDFFIDLAYRRYIREFQYQPYAAPENGSLISWNVKDRIRTVFLTLGVKL